MLNYSEAYKDLLMELANRSVLTVSLEITITVVVIIAALFGNILVCVAIYKSKILHTKQNVYIINLAVTDLVMAALVMPFCLGVVATGRWPYNPTVCHFQLSVAMVSGLVSVETITLIALHRYIKVVYPVQRYNKIFKKKTVAISVVLTWIITLTALSEVIFTNSDKFLFHPGKVACFLRFTREGFTLHLLFSIVFFQIPLVVVSVCYYRVYKKISNHKATGFTNNKWANKTKSVREIKVNRLLFSTVISFALCYVLPINVVDISEYFLGQYTLPSLVYNSYSFLVAFSSCVNPILYNSLSREFRTEFMKLIGCRKIQRSFRVGSRSQVSQILSDNYVAKTVPLELKSITTVE